MATFRLFRGAVSTENEITGSVYDISSFVYKINNDFTFELPELQFSCPEYLSLGEDVIIAETGFEASKQIVFYIKKLNWDTKRRMYDYVCAHTLERLAYIPIRDFAGAGASWCDISLNYTQWNNQLGGWATQGQVTVWERCFVSALTAIKMMIYRITGTSVGSIDSSKIDDENSFYYWKYEDPPNYWHTVYLKYKELGLNMNCLRRVGSSTHTDISETEFIKIYKMTNCLDVLRYICASLMITINIFRADYAIEAYTVASQASASATLSLVQTSIEPYRLYEVATKRLAGGSFEWVFGCWNEMTTQFIPYTYGVNNPDRTIEETQVSKENNGVGNINCLSLRYPNFFRIYGISGNTYQAHTFKIFDAQFGTFEQHQLCQVIQDFWDVAYSRDKYEIASPGLDLRVPYVEHDLAARRMIYEVIT